MNKGMVVDIVSIIAVIVAPIVSVWIGQHLQDRALKRKDKMELFKTLMISRKRWTAESIRALNIIDVVFSGKRKKDEAVREAWKACYDSLRLDHNPGPNESQKITDAEDKLLETMAYALGYKDITWETIKNPYVPQWMDNEALNQQTFKTAQLIAANMVLQMGSGANQTNSSKPTTSGQDSKPDDESKS